MSEDVTHPTASSAAVAPARWRIRIDLSPNENEVRAAVLRPRVFIVTGIERPLLTIAHGADARGIHSEGGEVLACDVRAPITEREVVLLGTALVAVAFDEKVVV